MIKIRISLKRFMGKPKKPKKISEFRVAKPLNELTEKERETRFKKIAGQIVRHHGRTIVRLSKE